MSKIYNDLINVDNQTTRGNILVGGFTATSQIRVTVTGDITNLPSNTDKIWFVGSPGAPWNLRGVKTSYTTLLVDIILYNMTGQNMTIINNDGSVPFGNRIIANGNANQTVLPYNSVVICYDRTSQTWFVL